MAAMAIMILDSKHHLSEFAKYSILVTANIPIKLDFRGTTCNLCTSLQICVSCQSSYCHESRTKLFHSIVIKSEPMHGLDAA